MSHAFKLLKRKEGENVRLLGENEMVFSVVTMRAYVAALSLIGAPVAAPDNNVRLERRVRSLGINPFRAAGKLTAGMPPAELNRYIHILREYRAELMLKAGIYEKTLSFALKHFKRLYKDKGYSYNNYLDADSLKLCFAAFPGICKCPTASRKARNIANMRYNLFLFLCILPTFFFSYNAK